MISCLTIFYDLNLKRYVSTCRYDHSTLERHGSIYASALSLSNGLQFIVLAIKKLDA